MIIGNELENSTSVSVYKATRTAFLADLACSDRWIASNIVWWASAEEDIDGAELAKRLLDPACRGAAKLPTDDRSQLEQLLQSSP
jgi:hypothetical protein